MKPRLAITLGDPAGIGPEIVAAALRDRRVQAACEPIIIADPVAFRLHKERLPSAELVTLSGLPSQLRLGRPSLAAGRSAIEALESGLRLLRDGHAHALVTAPVSKESFAAAGLGCPGHTEYLAKRAGARRVGMLMVAGPLRALLMTRHVPLRDVAKRLTTAVIRDSAELTFDFVRRVLKESRPRLVVCGVNPHAGDQGLIGREERRTLRPALKALARSGLRVAGPFSADAVFPALAKGLYHAALAAYHDQGMIPLKLFAEDRLVNITLGLPFIRTSPGHGTAYDIAGRRRARPGPMIEAILLAAKYAPCANA